jgi:hypothetical protein
MDILTTNVTLIMYPLNYLYVVVLVYRSVKE